MTNKTRVLPTRSPHHLHPPPGPAYLAIALAALGPFLFQGAVNFLELSHGVDFFRAAISNLVFYPEGWLLTAVFCLFGLSLTALGTGIFSSFRSAFPGGSLLLGMIGIGFVFVGLYHAPFPGTAVTSTGWVHFGATLAVSVLFPVACFLVALSLRRSDHPGMYVYTMSVLLRRRLRTGRPAQHDRHL